jgi:hypothetical protein
MKGDALASLFEEVGYEFRGLNLIRINDLRIRAKNTLVP